jgi:cysteine desulfuration protein SufE
MPLPARLEQVLHRFQTLGREEKMAALVSYAKKLEPVPDRFLELTDAAYTVPECQTPVRIFSEVSDGGLHFYADINVRQSPTVAAFLSLAFSVLNGQPPSVTLALPSDFVRAMMAGIGLGTREVGLEALVARLKRHARAASEDSASENAVDS